MEEPLYLDPHFWVAVSFVMFVVLAAKPVGKALAKMLDTRSAQISADLAEARRLRDEAQATLQLYRKKQEDSLKETQELLARTKQDAARMAEQAEAELKAALDKRLKLAADRIAQSETRALQEVQNHVVDIAIAAARTLIQEHLDKTGGKDLIKQAAGELERKLH
jgi:F-type H+-transporting ATPase subunit b